MPYTNLKSNTVNLVRTIELVEPDAWETYHQEQLFAINYYQDKEMILTLSFARAASLMEDAGLYHFERKYYDSDNEMKVDMLIGFGERDVVKPYFISDMLTALTDLEIRTMLHYAVNSPDYAEHIGAA